MVFYHSIFYFALCCPIFRCCAVAGIWIFWGIKNVPIWSTSLNIRKCVLHGQYGFGALLDKRLMSQQLKLQKSKEGIQSWDDIVVAEIQSLSSRSTTNTGTIKCWCVRSKLSNGWFRKNLCVLDWACDQELLRRRHESSGGSGDMWTAKMWADLLQGSKSSEHIWDVDSYSLMLNNFRILCMTPYWCAVNSIHISWV